MSDLDPEPTVPVDLDTLADAPSDENVDPFEELRRAREEIESEALWVDLDIPTWNGKLVGRFTPLTAKEKTELKARVEQRAKTIHQPAKGELIKLATLDRVATGCRELRINGKLIPGDSKQGGFSAAFAATLDLTGDTVTSIDVAREACGDPEGDEFVAFWGELTAWWSKPRPRSVTDPFGVS